ncbi:MAG: hypothetical protein KA313_09730 [Pseudarcicella sp.]|nr:hypothetical protein [Pseudarcicella sp.]MBP6411368.1 hypothetical protein [Pseudarcicella sp.]
MADIEIKEPLSISVEVKEFDENLPSIKLDCIFKGESLKGNFNIGFNFWVLCKDYDSFSKNENSFLNDLSGKTRLSFKDSKLLIVPSFRNNKTDFECKIILEISEESKQIFMTKFIEFEKWW